MSILHTEGILQPQTDRKTGPADRKAGPADRKDSDPSDTKAKDDICTEENAHRNYALVEKWREVEKVSLFTSFTFNYSYFTKREKK